ncbi:hypothetical protein [[Mycoplasma] testudinis]|uniref:hypothetical protein n=1 Tax=[Mycoplasma] testudinis TaxID=33924 RepID=UPI0004830F25|nr:hypothetical protein [[Mycoplasma] testudinis]
MVSKAHYSIDRKSFDLKNYQAFFEKSSQLKNYLTKPAILIPLLYSIAYFILVIAYAITQGIYSTSNFTPKFSVNINNGIVVVSQIPHQTTIAETFVNDMRIIWPIGIIFLIFSSIWITLKATNPLLVYHYIKKLNKTTKNHSTNWYEQQLKKYLQLLSYSIRQYEGKIVFLNPTDALNQIINNSEIIFGKDNFVQKYLERIKTK